MADEKIITIITTLYNKSKYLETWAKSLAKQTYLDKMNILVIEDCSTDDSLKILEKFTKKYRLPVKILRNEKNMGLLYTIRKAYRELQTKDIKTKYFAVLDADDYYISPKKIEKAVKFLESHEDFSAYASNYFNEYSSGLKKPLFEENIPSGVFEKMRGIPFFQTSAMVFRNFFTPKLLDRMDYFTEEKNFGICEGDSFRNAMAFGFGKIYFENSVDALWRCDVGDWGTLSEIEKYLINLKVYFELYQIYSEQFNTNFNNDDNANYILNMAITFYIESLKLFERMMRNLDFYKFEGTPYFSKQLKNFGATGKEQILNTILYCGQQFYNMGLVIDGE